MKIFVAVCLTMSFMFGCTTTPTIVSTYSSFINHNSRLIIEVEPTRGLIDGERVTVQGIVHTAQKEIKLVSRGIYFYAKNSEHAYINIFAVPMIGQYYKITGLEQKVFNSNDIEWLYANIHQWIVQKSKEPTIVGFFLLSYTHRHWRNLFI